MTLAEARNSMAENHCIVARMAHQGRLLWNSRRVSPSAVVLWWQWLQCRDAMVDVVDVLQVVPVGHVPKRKSPSRIRAQGMLFVPSRGAETASSKPLKTKQKHGGRVGWQPRSEIDKPQQDSSPRHAIFVPRRGAETASSKPMKAKQKHGGVNASAGKYLRPGRVRPTIDNRWLIRWMAKASLKMARKGWALAMSTPPRLKTRQGLR